MEAKEDVLKYKKKLKPYEIRRLWISRVVIWLAIILTMFPIVAIVAASMAPGSSFTQETIFPKSINFDNYVKVIKDTDFLIWVKNSVIICFFVSVIQLVITIPAAFAFSRMRFKGRKYGLMVLILLQMFPSMLYISAILAIAYSIPNGMDNMFVLIMFLCGGSAYNIWLVKGYIDSLPKELDEAALVDGASVFQVFTKIILPLLRPMLVVIFIFSFVSQYSEFILTSALMKTPGMQTVATGLRTFITNNFSANWTQYSAAAIMASLPIVIIFLGGQKYIAKGLVAGAIKG